MKNVYLYIATPMYGGMCGGVYTKSMIMLLANLTKMGMNYSFLFRYNESLITRARNALVANFLETDATHLLFIDADIGFEPMQIIKMIEADKDIICGIYPNKSINWTSVFEAVHNGALPDDLPNYTAEWVVNMPPENANVPLNANEPFEIINGGTGMMLIKRRVFEKLKTIAPQYVCNEKDPVMQKFQNKKITEYFATSIDDEDGVLLSEDYHFCKLWRSIGGKIWAAPWVELSHSGTYVFNGKPMSVSK